MMGSMIIEQESKKVRHKNVAYWQIHLPCRLHPRVFLRTQAQVFKYRIVT